MRFARNASSRFIKRSGKFQGAGCPCCGGPTGPWDNCLCGCRYRSDATLSITLPTLVAHSGSPTQWETDAVAAHNAVVAADFVLTLSGGIQFEAVSAAWYDGGAGPPFRWRFVFAKSCGGSTISNVTAVYLEEGGVDIGRGYNIESTGDCCEWTWDGTDLVWGVNTPDPPLFDVSDAGGTATIAGCEACAPCEDCTEDAGICGHNAILAGFTPLTYNGPITTLADGLKAGTCAGGSVVDDMPMEFALSCADGIWYLGLSDAVANPGDPTEAVVAIGPGDANGRPRPGTYAVTFTGGVLDGQSGTVELVAVPTGDPLCP